jgi:uncharacterized protein
MNLLTKFWATTAAVLVGGVLAVPTPARASAEAKELPGALQVYDDANVFSADAKKQAEKKMSAAKFDRGLHFTVETFPAIPEQKKQQYKTDGKSKFFKEWAKTQANGDRARGPYVLICMDPGYTEVVLDTETSNRGFDQSNTTALEEIFNSAFIEAAKKPTKAEKVSTRDAALLKATDYVISDLKGTKVVHTDGTPTKDEKAAAKKGASGMSIGGWICIGLAVLLAIWLVVGLIRAFTGGGGGGGGGYGGGGGGGGGGFMTGLFGGLFGAMAGMWLYNNMFGGHSSFGSDAYASDGSSGGADTGDTGAGDYDGGTSAGGGGDYGGGGDDAGGGGGDYGGGGGDFGGGDFGGGGGDFGGGDF